MRQPCARGRGALVRLGGVWLAACLLAGAAPVAAASGGPPASPPGTEAAPGQKAQAVAAAPGLVVKTILGLLAMLSLAYLGAHPRIRRLEEALGLRQVITAGFAFVALGVIARHPAVGVLSDEVLTDLTPLLHFGLGWLGFLMGFHHDLRVFDRLPRGALMALALDSVLPFALVAVTGGGLMLAFGMPFDDATFLRDAIALATAGAISASRIRQRPPLWDPDNPDKGLGQRADLLDEVAGVVGLAVLAAFFRPTDANLAWELPGTAWLLITLGLGVALGLLVLAVMRTRATNAEFFTLTLGSVAFCAGIAGYLWLSPIAVCFVAGSMLTNVPREQKERLWALLNRLERPIYLLFLIVAGALWDFADWHGWVLLPAFLASRAAGSFISQLLYRRAGSPPVPGWSSDRPVVTPISVVSIAIVVSVQWLYRGQAIPWIVTAVIAGAVLTEIFVQLWSARRRRAEHAAE